MPISKPGGTAFGVISIILWSTSVACTRFAVEGLGVFRAGAVVLTLAGCLLITMTSIRMRGLGWITKLSRKHVLYCGPLFAAYMILLYMAVGMARSRGEAIAAGLANYLWPTAILVFSIFILKHRARRHILAIGITCSLAGVVVASSVRVGGLGQIADTLWPPPPAIGYGLLAATLWGLYSVLANKFPQRNPSGAVGIYLLVAGAMLIAFEAGNWQAVQWSRSTVAAVGYMVILPNSLAYWLWEIAVRDGHVPTLGALANLVPLISAIIGVIVLGVGFRWEILLGGALVAVGATLSRTSFRSPMKDKDPQL